MRPFLSFCCPKQSKFLVRIVHWGHMRSPFLRVVPNSTLAHEINEERSYGILNKLTFQENQQSRWIFGGKCITEHHLGMLWQCQIYRQQGIQRPVANTKLHASTHAGSVFWGQVDDSLWEWYQQEGHQYHQKSWERCKSQAIWGWIKIKPPVYMLHDGKHLNLALPEYTWKGWQSTGTMAIL